MALVPTARRGLWTLLVLVLLAVSIGGAVRLGRRAEPPPVLGDVPAFRLIGSDGRALGAAELRGRPWIAGFVFTRCSGVCPVVSGAMAALQKRLAGRRGSRTRLVSFSVDPAHDTPEVLQRYARGFAADPERWWFLTGDADALHALVRDGFKLSVARAPEGSRVPVGELVTHSDRLVLVDAGLRVRGYYHSGDPASIDRLLADLAAVEAEGR